MEQAHVAGLMCATGLLNGVPSCSDPYTYSTLASWDFTGFVRSDERAARKLTAAFATGLDLIKPALATTVTGLVRSGSLPVADLNRAARTVLTEMFAYGLIAHPRLERPFADAASPHHTSVALLAAEESAVLLKDEDHVLPLASTTKSVAVIGADAAFPGYHRHWKLSGHSSLRRNASSGPDESPRIPRQGDLRTRGADVAECRIA